MKENDIFDWGFGKKEEKELVSVNVFVILFFLTMGLYGTWWMYKTWRYLKEKDNLDIMPAMRAIFAIIFLYELLVRIQERAHSRGYQQKYYSGPLFIGFILLSFLTQLPAPMWVISQLAFLFLISPFTAFNYVLMREEGLNYKQKDSLSQRQIILAFFGAVLWSMAIMELVMGGS